MAAAPEMPGRAPDAGSETIHATCISVGNRAVLFRGRSGSGKSDLALRCLAVGATPLTPLPARLVADDQVVITRQGARLMATSPPTIAGLIEVRGVGIVQVPTEIVALAAQVVLIVDLNFSVAGDRLSDTVPRDQLLGIALPVLTMEPFFVTSALKVLLAINEIGVASLP